LQRRIKSIVQHAECYSSEDFPAGAVWGDELFKKLEGNHVGLVCLSRANLNNPWIHFEAGALALKSGKKKVCPLLIDLEEKDVSPPLSMFQMKTLERDDLYEVLGMINNEHGDERRLPPEELLESFDHWWPKLKQELAAVKTKECAPKEIEPRTEQNMFEEILNS
jgi:hypothetical protein